MNRHLVAVTPAVLLAVVIAGGCGSSRPALSAAQKAQVTDAVRQGLSRLAASPASGISRGTEVILTPMCVSTTDSRYVAVVAYPIDRGQVAQPAFVYVLHGADGYRMLEVFRTGDQMLERPPVVPTHAWNGIGVGRSCLPTAPDRVAALRKSHAVPDFRIR